MCDPSTSSAASSLADVPGTNASGKPDIECRRCPFCGENIWRDAQKCTHCNTDFTWRGYVTVSSTTLALLTALISVISASLPALRLALTADNSVIASSLVGVSPNGDTISLLLNNSGRRAGVIDRLSLGVDYGSERHYNVYPHLKNDEAVVIEPGKATLVTFYFQDARQYWEPPQARADLPSLGGDATRPLLRGATCKYWVRITNADGQRPASNPPTTFSCQDTAFQIFRRLTDIDRPAASITSKAAPGGERK